MVNGLLNFTENFPHTTARFRHWLYLISDENLDHWNVQHLFLIAMLPAYLIFFWDRLEMRYLGSWPPKRTFHSLNQAIVRSFFASKYCSTFAILYIGWSFPSGGSRLITWIDLCLESQLSILVAISMWSIPWCLASLAYGWRNLIADILDFFRPPLNAD